MAKDPLSSKLAVILHADVAGSTRLVQLDEQLAHKRIQDTFKRFGDTVGKYHGRVQELRGEVCRDSTLIGLATGACFSYISAKNTTRVA